MTTQEILETLPGQGEVREATEAFWEIRNNYKKTVNRLGFQIYKNDAGKWLVSLKYVDMATEFTEVLSSVKADNAFYKSSVWQDTNEKFTR